jgi:WD40 repeat protein
MNFSPDGKTLASASWDKTVKLWNVATGKELKSLTKDQGQIWSVSYAPDGKTLAFAGIDGTVELWDAVTGKELASLTMNQGNITNVSIGVNLSKKT